MIPIFEQGSGKGIGHGLDSFIQRFDQICAEHATTGRAKAFAFILYDFNNTALRRILKDQGVFARLDRLSGSDLSIFYLHARTSKSLEAFNEHFISALGVEETPHLPCVIFFRVENGTNIKDIEVTQLDSADLIHCFNELYEVVAKYIAAKNTQSGDFSIIKWLKVSGKFVGLEALRAGLKKGLELLWSVT